MIRRLTLSAGLLLAVCALACADSHTVQPGENLYLIAKRHGVSMRDLVRCNGITNQRLIRPGMVLEIPSAAESDLSESEPAVAAAARAESSLQEPPNTAVAKSQPQPKPKPAPQPADLKPTLDAAPSQPAPATASGIPLGMPEASPTGPAATPLDEDPLPRLALTAERGPEEQPEPRERKGVSAGLIADLMLKLLLVLVFAYLSVWALKKVSHRRGRLLPAHGSLHILETTSLAPNRGLHLVAVGQRVFLVGSTPENITVLGEVSDVAEVGQRLEAEASRPSFGAQLQAMFKRKEPRQGLGGVIAGLRDGTFFVKQATERARGLGRQGAALDRHG